MHCNLRSRDAVNLTVDPVNLIFDLWPWTFAVYSLWCDETLYQSINPRRSYCDFNIWPYDLERRVTYCARLWYHQVWPSTTYPCLSYGVFWCWWVTSCCDLDLWPVDLESSWYIKRHVVKVGTKFKRNRTIRGWIGDFAMFCTRYVIWPEVDFYNPAVSVVP